MTLDLSYTLGREGGREGESGARKINRIQKSVFC